MLFSPVMLHPIVPIRRRELRRQWSWLRPNPRSHLQACPPDVLLEIAEHMDGLADVSRLARTCSRIHAFVSPALYVSVDLHSYQQCMATLAMLLSRPGLARHVRALSVRPDGRGQYSRQRAHDVSALLYEVAHSLDALQSFCWDSEEVPPCDDVWFALKQGCRRLTRIDTTAGWHFPSPRSWLFEFTKLTSFSVTLKSGYFARHLDDFWLEEKPECAALWNMLDRCPDLEELRVEGFAFQSIDARKLCSRRWPRLRTLWLGDVTLQMPTAGATPDASLPPFIDFLAAHPGLERLQITRHSGIAPEQLLALPEGALGKLAEFSGTIEQAHRLTGSVLGNLRALRLTDPLLLGQVATTTISGVFGVAARLQSLTIGVVLQPWDDNRWLLRCICHNCPGLVHLDFSSSRKPCLSVAAVSSDLAHLPRLRTLALTLVRTTDEAPLAEGALKLVRGNPRLTDFSITLISRWTELPRGYVGAAWREASGVSNMWGGVFERRGVFRLEHDRHGLPVRVQGREMRRRIWQGVLGWSVGSEKKFSRDLRPQVRKRGLRELVFESSAAGDELRVLIFCGMLAVLAVWGFWTRRWTERGGRVI